MKERFSVPTASVVLLLRERNGKKQVLLQRRQNTGFMDGLWDLSCSGHVEHGESMTEGAVREAKEELGISVRPADMKFFVFVHKREAEWDLTYCNAYFFCTEFNGEPRICEPKKCSELQWFDFDGLPEDLINDRRLALKAFIDGVHYIEYGWGSK